MNNLKFFDFEVYPNWWCCAVSDEEPNYPGGAYNNQFTKETEEMIKSKMRVYTSDDTNANQNLIADLETNILCGYNIKHYDLMIAKCIAAGMPPDRVAIANEILISDYDDEVCNKSVIHQKVYSFLKYTKSTLYAEGWQDLLDDSVKTLKDKECALGIDIRETTVSFDKVNLTPEDKENIIFYNKHDVYALHVLYVTTSKPYIDTKIQLCDNFHLPRRIGYVNTNANLCGKVLGAERAHGTTIIDPTITIRDKNFADYFEKWLPKDIYEHLLTKVEGKEFELCENIVSIGDGGLHSVYKVPKVGRVTPALYVESTDEYTMYNVDVSSCYPSVMMFCNAMSRAIKLPARFHYIYKRRLDLKLTPKDKWTLEDKLFVPAAKLILNTTYGAMGNKWLDLYDDYMRSKVCRVGQMILISIMNNLYQSIPGLKVIQTNTDGVLVYAKRSDYSKIQAIVDEFSSFSHFVFEIEEDNRLWQLNVNNYIAIHPNGEMKNKGGSFIMSVYQKGTNKLCPLGNFCVPKAQIAFLMNNENPVENLLNNTNVEDFCVTCTNVAYKSMVQLMNDGTEVPLGKVGRCIAVTNERFGLVKKRKIYNGEPREATVALCPPHPLMVNDDLKNYFIKDGYLYNTVTKKRYEIDYSYYCKELDKALDTIWYSIVNDKIGFTHKFDI